jgi:redox-sensitive bicupin YhaK (pirin superfamily)
MIQIRRAEDRGHIDHGWLDTYHTFSFGDYYDPHWMGYRSLRVINDDRVAPGHGFPTHGHRDMEIITYVLEGELEHKDSMGNGGVIRPGEIQYMSAGTGVRHSEFNPSTSAPVHLLQIWIVPQQERLDPTYAQKQFGDARRGRLCLLASADGRDGSIQIRKAADVYASLLAASKSVEYHLAPGRGAWLHVARGEVEVNGQVLQAGDAAAIEGEETIVVSAPQQGEILLLDLA